MLIKNSKEIVEQAAPPRGGGSNQGAQPPRDNSGANAGGGAQPPRDNSGANAGGGVQPPRDNKFACLLKRTGYVFSSASNTVVFEKSNLKWTFFSNNRFAQKDPYRKGSWYCDGGDHFTIKLDNGNSYSSKTNIWSQNTTSPENTSTDSSFTDTNLTGDNIKTGQVVKYGMKGSIVGDIQKLLIAKGYKDISKSGNVDNLFGGRTKAMVQAFQKANGLKDDGIVGKDTWPKLNDPSAVVNSSSTNNSSGTVNQAINLGSRDEVPGSDAIIIRESRKKLLRKYLQEFK